MSFKVGDTIKIKETKDFIKLGIGGKTGEILSINQMQMEVYIFDSITVTIEKDQPTDHFETIAELVEPKKSVPHGWLQWKGPTK